MRHPARLNSLRLAHRYIRGSGQASSPAFSVQAPGGYTWANVTGIVGPTPSARLASMAWDGSDGYVLLFGWESFTGYPTDTWTYLGGNWTNITASVTGTPPSPQNYAVMAFDPSTQKVVMVSSLHNTTWTYHAKVWTNITSTAGPHPPTQIYGSLVADTTDGELLYFGGTLAYGSSPYDHATWSFKNGVWTNISSTASFDFGRMLLVQGTDDPFVHGVIAVGLSEWHNTTPYSYHPATFQFSGGVWTNLTSSLSQEPRMPYLGVSAYVPSISAVVIEQSAGVNTTGNNSGDPTTHQENIN